MKTAVSVPPGGFLCMARLLQPDSELASPIWLTESSRNVPPFPNADVGGREMSRVDPGQDSS